MGKSFRKVLLLGLLFALCGCSHVRDAGADAPEITIHRKETG